MTEIVTTVVLAILPLASILAIVLGRSYLIIILYSIVILLFTASDIGASKDYILIYARGGGVLPLTLLNFFLIALFAFFLFGRILFKRSNKARYSFKPGNKLLVLLIFCVVYILLGFGNEVPVREVLSPKGTINIINMCLFVFLFIWGIESPEQLDRLVNIALWCLFLSALYGMIRYILFGGDPANSYAHDLSVNVRLTYQDIGQSILFGFAFAYSILRLLKKQYSGVKDCAFFVALSLLSVFNVIFSFRRNAWVGFLIVLVFLVLILDMKKKIIVITIAALLCTVLGSYVIAKRFTGKNIGGSHYSMTGDFSSKGSIEVKKGRFAELWNASAETLDKHPLFGFGPWGHYGSKYDLGEFAYFTHSGIVHVLLKTGLVGLFLFCWPLVSLFIWTLRRRKLFPQNSKYLILGDAAFGGILFTIPELLFGTPIIIFRHLQILGFFIALVYCAYFFRAPRSKIQECGAVPSPERWCHEAAGPSNVV